MIRAVKLIAAVVAGLVLLAVLSAALLLTWPRPAAEYLASHLLGRRVAMAEFSIRWQEPVQIALRDLHVANIEGGSSPDMLAIDALDATLDRAALLQGKVIYESLNVERPRIALERDAQGRGNWEFGAVDAAGDSSPSDSANRLVLVPKNRQQFPTLLDFHLAHGELRLKTSSGKWLRLPLDDLKIQTNDEDSPVSITFDGGYNDTDAQLTASTASFNAFRDAATPFDAGFSIITPGAKLDFKGVIGEPLDFESVQGRLSLEARRLDDLVTIFDAPTGIVAPLKLAGGFSREGDAWRLDGINGDISGNRFEGRIALDEGARGEADAMQFHLDFASLDLPSVLPKENSGSDWKATALRPATAPDTAHLDIQLSTGTLTYETHQLRQVAAAIEVEAGHIRLHGATAQLKDGHLELNGHLQADDKDGGKLQAALKLDKADAGALLQALGIATGPERLGGIVDGKADVSLQGATLGDAVKTARGHAVLAMPQGRIARSLVEAASADLSAVFRGRDEATVLRCLLGAATLKDGTVLLAPLVLRSDGGTIRGAGQIDLAQQQIEMTLRSDPKTTGLLALDIPIRVHGAVDNPSVTPLRGASLPELPAPALPAEQKALAQGNPCWN